MRKKQSFSGINLYHVPKSNPTLTNQERIRYDCNETVFPLRMSERSNVYSPTFNSKNNPGWLLRDLFRLIIEHGGTMTTYFYIRVKGWVGTVVVGPPSWPHRGGRRWPTLNLLVDGRSIRDDFGVTPPLRSQKREPQIDFIPLIIFFQRKDKTIRLKKDPKRSWERLDIPSVFLLVPLCDGTKKS